MLLIMQYLWAIQLQLQLLRVQVLCVKRKWGGGMVSKLSTLSYYKLITVLLYQDLSNIQLNGTSHVNNWSVIIMWEGHFLLSLSIGVTALNTFAFNYMSIQNRNCIMQKLHNHFLIAGQLSRICQYPPGFCIILHNIKS